MQESFIIQSSRKDVYYHLIALCQNDALFSISDYRKDMQDQDFERIIISDAKLVSEQGEVKGAVIGTIRLLPHGNRTTAMFVDKDAVWNKPIPDAGKRLFGKFIKRAKKHFKDIHLLEEGTKSSIIKVAKRKPKSEAQSFENIKPSTPKQDSASKTQITIAVISATAIVIAACITFMGSIISALGPKAVDVASTSVVKTPTQPICDPDSFQPITATPIPPSLIIIVLDTSGAYSNYSTRSIDLISNVLPRVLDTGDRVVVIEMGAGNFTKAVLFDRAIQTQNDTLVYLPPLQNSTPTMPASVTPGSGIQMVAATMTAQAQVTAIAAISTQSQFAYTCALTQYKNYRTQATQFAAQLEDTKKEFMVELSQKANNSGTTSIPNQVFESLDIAELVLDDECSRFSQCKLIIFSDLEEWRTTAPDYLTISLEKADVLSVMLNCEEIFQPTCQKAQTTWIDIFKSLNVKTLSFTGSKKAETNLIEFLRK